MPGGVGRYVGKAGIESQHTVHAGYMMSALLGVVLKDNNGRGTCGPGGEKRRWVVGDCPAAAWLLGALAGKALERSHACGCTECRAR
jgi:hypothetical protein